MKLKIKRIAASDMGSLSVLAKAFHEEEAVVYPHIEGDDMEKAMFMVLENLNNPEVIQLIAYDGKKPIGFMIGSMGTHIYGKPTRIGVAQQLYVVPEKRGHAVGIKLSAVAIRWAIENGAEGIEALGSFGRSDVRWMDLGFKPYMTVMHMSLDDAMNVFKAIRNEK